MTLVTGFTVDGLQAQLDDLEATITALVDAQHTSDLAAYSDISEPVAVTVRNERIAAITQEQSDRDAAILVETNWRNYWVTQITPLSAVVKKTNAILQFNNFADWTNYDTATDIVLPAAAGDFVEVAISCVWGVEATGGFLDVVSVVGGNPYRSWGLDAAPVAIGSNVYQGVQGWRGEAGHNSQGGGSVARRLIAGDIEGGNVRLRVRVGTSGSTLKTLYGSTANPFHFRATNYKQG